MGKHLLIRAAKELIAAHRITPEELGTLETIELFGELKSLDDLLLILRNIRGDRPETPKSRKLGQS